MVTKVYRYVKDHVNFENVAKVVAIIAVSHYLKEYQLVQGILLGALLLTVVQDI